MTSVDKFIYRIMIYDLKNDNDLKNNNNAIYNYKAIKL